MYYWRCYNCSFFCYHLNVLLAFGMGVFANYSVHEMVWHFSRTMHTYFIFSWSLFVSYALRVILSCALLEPRSLDSSMPLSVLLVDCEYWCRPHVNSNPQNATRNLGRQMNTRCDIMLNAILTHGDVTYRYN